MNRSDELWAKQWLRRPEVQRALARLNDGRLPPEVVRLLAEWDAQGRAARFAGEHSRPMTACRNCGFDERIDDLADWQPPSEFEWAKRPDPVPQMKPQMPPRGRGVVIRPDGWMTTRELSERWGLTQSRIRQLADAGVLECQQSRPGARRLVRFPSNNGDKQ